MHNWLPDQRIVLGLPDGHWNEHILALLARVDYPDRERLFVLLREREARGSTMIGHGVSVPHCLLPELSGPQVVAGTLATPSPEERLFFLLLSPDSGSHLQNLARVATLCQKEEVVLTACEATDPESFRQALQGIPV